MDEHEATVANADLWSVYFRDQWDRSLMSGQPAPWPVGEIADVAAATVAIMLTLMTAAPIARLWRANALPPVELATS